MNSIIQNRLSAASVLLTAFLLLGCADKSQRNRTFTPVKEETAEIEFSALKTAAFDRLSLEQKQLLFYLTQAAVSGDPIVYQQIHPDGYQIKLMLDGIVSYTVGMDKTMLNAAEDYAKRFYANHGFYQTESGLKFIPRDIDGPRLKMMTMVALSNGARIGFTDHRIIIALFNELDSVIFNPEYEAVISGVRIRLPIPACQPDSIYAGNDTLAPGACSQEAVRIVDYLRAAEPFCPPEQRETLLLLAKYWETGNDSLYTHYLDENCAGNYPVDCLLGFLPAEIGGEFYEDFLYQAYVYIADSAHQSLAARALEEFYASKNPDSTAAADMMNYHIDIQAAEIFAAAGFAGYQIPQAIALSNPANKTLKIILFTNLIASLQPDNKLDLSESGAFADIMYQINHQITQGHRFAAAPLKRHAFITPLPKLKTTKMGKVTDVALEYPESVRDYSIKLADISRVLPQISQDKLIE